MAKATVYKSTGSWYIVKTEDGKFFNARIKGVFKLDNITSTNPVAVGDEVSFEPDTEAENTVIISKISERNNYIARISPHNKNQRHIVASNLDQVLLFATLKNPKTSEGFIDRFLVSTEAFHVPAVLVFNKTDLYRKKELEQLEALSAIYEKIGYMVLHSSIEKAQGIEKINALLKNKTTLISGHSGVGKSTFINEIIPDKTLRTQEVSGWSGKGMHTTTFAEMFDLLSGGRIIDTPGIREFGISDIEPVELSHYFPEMLALLPKCRFNNCMHLEEPDCAVRAAVSGGNISVERYISYQNILSTLKH